MCRRDEFAYVTSNKKDACPKIATIFANTVSPCPFRCLWV
jgi:hypothetical protein